MTDEIGAAVRSYRTTTKQTSALEENDMTATYTFDVFSSLDGYGAASTNWTGFEGRAGRVHGSWLGVSLAAETRDEVVAAKTVDSFVA
jgi:hypothetical protein